MSINKCGQSLAFGERGGVRGNWTHAISTDSGALRLWSYAGIRQVLPGRQSRRPPCEPTDEANRCNLRHVTPKTLQKALYVGFSESSRPLQVVCLGWSQFPVPKARLRSEERR